MNTVQSKKIGVIIVTYGSSDVILDCLASLQASGYPDLKIVVCDNASPDDTRELVRGFAGEQGVDFLETRPADYEQQTTITPPRLTLVSSAENLGYAGGVNLGLDYLMKSEEVGYFWILNPDSVVRPDTAAAYASALASSGNFGLMTGRTLYYGEGGMIQSDGGWVSLWTGVCRNLNQGKMQQDVSMPELGSVNFLSGANFIATREFVEKVGNMRDDYFLYYEEVDWAMQRGDMAMALCPEAIVLHHGGTSIGSGTVHRIPSAFSNFFNYRNRMIFMWRFRPWAIPVSYTFSVLKIVQLLLKGARTEAYGAWRGLNLMRPPADVENRVVEQARKHAFKTRFPR